MIERLGFRILEVPFRAEVEGSPALVQRIRALTTTYAERDPAGASRAPAISYRVLETPPSVERDHTSIYEGDSADDLVPWLEADWCDQAIARCGGWVLHAAAVEWAGRALVLAGASGEGKTTLTWALLGGGAGYLSDECVTLDGRGATGLSRPLSFVDGELPEPLPPGFSVGGYPYTRQDGQPTWAQNIVPPNKRLVRSSVPLAAIVLLRHAPHEPPGIRSLRAAEALLRLWPLTLSPSAEALEGATALLPNAPVFALTTRNVKGALSDLRSLLAPS